MSRKVIFTPRAPKPIGPYSQAVEAGGFVFVSGQIPLNPQTGEVVEGGIKEQTKQVLENIKAILEASGLAMENVVYVSVFLRDLKLFSEFNEVYSQYFTKDPPARVTIQAADLPRGVLLEVSVIAYRG
ncbi:RidA family protein [Infirmifilum lucidum]|uniref:RidA family protein n=1 Tax=Infirmifilum lucidum TaxID=2776706 RepID=A0A7L9FE22_9CREN|nr:RidA family protein [Infirmifilum lucidum]QOJ78058.1 RidA family protein [Infirmifilum lucidum]